jgi:Beta-propeller repeat
MHLPIPSLPPRVLGVASALIALVGLFAVLDLRSRIDVTGLPSTVLPVSIDMPDPEQTARLRDAYGKLPLSFEANEGQINSQVKFLARGSGYQLFLTDTEAVLVLSKSEPSFGKGSPDGRPVEYPRMDPSRRDARAKPEKSQGDLLRMMLVGANRSARTEGKDELPGKSNYFLGNDPAKWRRDVSNYAGVQYESVYPGVDVVYHGNQGQLEYDFIVAPHANYRQIKLQYKGAKRIHIDGESGDLILTTKKGSELRQHKPVIYQELAGVRREIEGKYELGAMDEIAFRIGDYDTRQTLIIDPTLLYSTYLGGNGNDFAQAIAVDGQGNVYVTGYTGSTDFPTQNPFQATLRSNADVFVTKLSASGNGLIYSTYLGGNGAGFERGIAVDGQGNAYVTGNTLSTDFAEPISSHVWRQQL